MIVDAEALFPGVYRIKGRIATENMVLGRKVYGEELFAVGGKEYRSWTPYRSKLSAAISNGMKTMEIREGSNVLYLGASTGTTPSHVSDIVGMRGRVYCVEISERSMRDLVGLCQHRGNMLPILNDASRPEAYADIVEECDVIYQDVSAKEQAGILKANSRFLKSGGYAYFVIKSQSIDISRSPSEVFKAELESLSGKFDVVEKIGLEPYDSMHLFVVLKKR